MTNTMNRPIETIEHNFPFRIKKYQIRKGSVRIASPGGGEYGNNK